MNSALTIHQFAIAALSAAMVGLLFFLTLPNLDALGAEEINPYSARIGEAHLFLHPSRPGSLQADRSLSDFDYSSGTKAMQIEYGLHDPHGSDRGETALVALGVDPDTKLFVDGIQFGKSRSAQVRAWGAGRGWLAQSVRWSNLPENHRITLIAEKGVDRTFRPLVLLTDEASDIELGRAVQDWMNFLTNSNRLASIVAVLASFVGLLIGRRRNFFTGAFLFAVSTAAFRLVAIQPGYEFSLQLAAFLAGLCGLVLIALDLPRLASRLSGLLAGLLLPTILAWLSVAALLLANPAQTFPPWFLHFANLGYVPFLLLAVTAAMLSDGSRYMETLATARAEIARRDQLISQQASELEEGVRKQAVLQERQRFMRDMHDGVGGQLLSLLIRVRSGNIAMDSVEGEIEKGIADLRLVVDSLDQIDGDFATAMATFRARAEQQLDGSGVALEWDQGAGISAWHLDSRETLGVFRILQEALSNALRHGKPGKIAVALSAGDPLTGELQISIADDGRGFDQDGVSVGKGLQNMQERIQKLSGKMELQTSKEAGTVLKFRIPAKRN